jgi:stage V sporulation protein G
MEITEVKVFPIQEEKLKAFVSIVFDQCFMVNDIKIIQGRDGLFISMPSRKKKNGEFKDVAHPLNNETRRMIEDKVLVEYERILGDRGEPLPAPAGMAQQAPAAPRAAARAAVEPPRTEAGTGMAAMAAASSVQGPSMQGNIGAAPLAQMAPLAPIVADGAAAPASAEHAAGSPAAPPGEKTLEEIEEMHLRDSFWTVT